VYFVISRHVYILHILLIRLLLSVFSYVTRLIVLRGMIYCVEFPRLLIFLMDCVLFYSKKILHWSTVFW